VVAVEDALKEAGFPRALLAGNGTALLYATASAYGASNRAFIEGAGATTLHFPYTAPSAVPAEVAIEFGITGPYVIFLGGAPATLSALWYAATLLASSACDRALVLAVETFDECADLYARGRWLVGRPLVEAAGCALLEPGAGALSYSEGRSRRPARTAAGGVQRRLGEAFACTPLVELVWRGPRGPRRWICVLPGCGADPRPSCTGLRCDGMERKEVLDELRTILRTRLKFDPARTADLTMETTLPKGLEGSLGLDSLDFIELSVAIEERFGLVIDESEDLAPHFQSMDALTRFICMKAAGQ